MVILMEFGAASFLQMVMKLSPVAQEWYSVGHYNNLSCIIYMTQFIQYMIFWLRNELLKLKRTKTISTAAAGQILPQETS
jgi:hypothetical protein